MASKASILFRLRESRGLRRPGLPRRPSAQRGRWPALPRRARRAATSRSLSRSLAPWPRQPKTSVKDRPHRPPSSAARYSRCFRRCGDRPQPARHRPQTGRDRPQPARDHRGFPRLGTMRTMRTMNCRPLAARRIVRLRSRAPVRTKSTATPARRMFGARARSLPASVFGFFGQSFALIAFSPASSFSLTRSSAAVPSQVPQWVRNCRRIGQTGEPSRASSFASATLPA